MSEEFLDTDESLNIDETQDSNLETESNEESDIEAKLKKAEELANNQRIRAERAEKALKATKQAPVQKEVEKEVSTNNLSLKDIRALQDVPDEDVDDVTDYAKFKGISIAEAKKHSVMQALLKTRAEERATASASNVVNTKRNSSKNSESAALERLNKGEDMSDDEFRLAAQARIKANKTK